MSDGPSHRRLPLAAVRRAACSPCCALRAVTGARRPSRDAIELGAARADAPRARIARKARALGLVAVTHRRSSLGARRPRRRRARDAASTSAMYVVALRRASCCCCATACGRSRRWLTLDGILAGLTLAALASTALRPRCATRRPRRRDARGRARPRRRRPAACSSSCWSPSPPPTGGPGRTWWLLGGGARAARSPTRSRRCRDDYATGTRLDSLWLAALVVVALAAWQRAEPRRPAPHVGWAMRRRAARRRGGQRSPRCSYAGLDRAAAADASAWPPRRCSPRSPARVLMLRRELPAAARARAHEALTDKLTELPNRRALNDDLDKAAAAAARTRSSSSTSTASRTTTTPSATRRATRCCAASRPRSRGVGRAYRLGGDEFCLLLPARSTDETPLDRRARSTRSASTATASASAPRSGSSCSPTTRRTPTEALRLADERMYARKRRRRGGSRGQARDVLVKVMAEREPSSTHDCGVAELAATVGRRLGLDAEELDVLVRAAELHDVGKVAVPDAILAQARPARRRPSGRSCASTPIAGERILGRGREHAPGRAARALRARALGRARLPRRPARRGDPARRPHHLRLRRLRCDAAAGGPYKRADVATPRRSRELRRCAGTPVRSARGRRAGGHNLDTVVSGWRYTGARWTR